MKSFATLSVAFIVLVGLARPVYAQQEGFNVDVTVRGHTGPVAGAPSDDFLSFSSPVGIPGVGLAPGTYIFRHVTPSVMQVLSEDRSTTYAMFFVTPVSRSEVTDEYSLTLQKLQDDAPARLTAVFRPSALTGYEPRYPMMTTEIG